MHAPVVTQFTKNLLRFIYGGDLTTARNFVVGREKTIAAMKPHQVRLVRRACARWGAEPVL